MMYFFKAFVMATIWLLPVFWLVIVTQGCTYTHVQVDAHEIGIGADVRAAINELHEPDCYCMTDMECMLMYGGDGYDGEF